MTPDVKITDNSKQVIEAKDDAVERILTEIGLHLEGEAKIELENVPTRVDTGLLRNSITYAVDGHTPAITEYHASEGSGSGRYFGSVPAEDHGGAVYVGTNVEYAIYVHEGTRSMAPDRFILNAVRKNAGRIGKREAQIPVCNGSCCQSENFS